MTVDIAGESYTSHSAGHARITIELVDMNRLVVGGYDRINKWYELDMTIQPPLVSIPEVGEQWVVSRMMEDWYLCYRLEWSNDEDSINTLIPGDRRINGSRILLNGDVVVNGHPLNHGVEVNENVPSRADAIIDGVNTVFYSSQGRIPGTLQVWVNGLATIDFTELNNAEFEFALPPFLNSVIGIRYLVAVQDYVAESQMTTEQMDG